MTAKDDLHRLIDATEDEQVLLALREHLLLQQLPPIGLEPVPFSVDDLIALGEIKLELVDGVLTGTSVNRTLLLRSLLANAGLREAIRLAPVDLWHQALRSALAPFRPPS